MSKPFAKRQNGFTLIELLVVIGILAILLAITLIAINPNKHFQDSRNTQRSSDVTALLDSIYQYEAANNGNLPPTVVNVPTTAASISRGVAQVATGTSFLTPNLTYTVPATNIVTSGMVTVTGCVQAGDNGTFVVNSGTATTIVVADAGGSATSSTGCSIRAGVNLCADVAPTYIADLPFDPSAGTVTGGTTPCAVATTSYSTGYTIAANNGRFTINAPSAEAGKTISVTR
jgi:prepilin-type N-terminal cleavage/methylation domain-containing protein